MPSKLRTRHIVSAHISTFKNYESGKYAPRDFALFLGIPVLVAGALLLMDAHIPDTSISALMAGRAIFAGLLFNLLLLVADVAVRSDSPDPFSGRGRLQARHPFRGDLPARRIP